MIKIDLLKNHPNTIPAFAHIWNEVTDYALNYRSFSVHTLSFRRFFMSFPRRRESSKYLKE